jgi:spore germination cell wall hydrolase CwlJ-like protein
LRPFAFRLPPVSLPAIRIRLPQGIVPSRISRYVPPAACAIGVFLAYPTITGYQDVASLAVPGSIAQQERWLAHVPQAPGMSVFAASADGIEMTELDPVVTGSARQPLAERKIDTAVGREPQRINRAGKGNRVVTVTSVSPPENFKAGAVVERQSMLVPFGKDNSLDLAFEKPLPNTEALKVASVFTRAYEDEPAPDLPVTVAKLVVESAPNVLAYAPDQEIASPFAAVLGEDEPVNLIPKLNEDDHSWAAQPLPLSVFSDREQNCLTAGIYFEARGEPVRGQAAVAQVILNRVKNPTYPDSICGVVYQNKEWRNRCQFSFACDRIKDRVRDKKQWEVASYVARETTHGRIWLPEVGSSTHYHATYVRPAWGPTMKRVDTIGKHIFYRTYGGGWS